MSRQSTEKHKYKEAEVSNPQRGRRSSKKSKSGKLTGAYQEPEHSANGAREAINGVARGEEVFDAGARGEKDRGEDTVAKANSVIIEEIIEETSS